MDTISLFDGFILTIISMVVVFIVLGAIWGLTELTAHFVKKDEKSMDQVPSRTTPAPAVTKKDLLVSEDNQKVAEIMALILASEDQPNKKFEIIETKRIK